MTMTRLRPAAVGRAASRTPIRLISPTRPAPGVRVSGAFLESGRWDSNPRHLAWEALPKV